MRRGEGRKRPQRELTEGGRGSLVKITSSCSRKTNVHGGGGAAAAGVVEEIQLPRPQQQQLGRHGRTDRRRRLRPPAASSPLSTRVGRFRRRRGTMLGMEKRGGWRERGFVAKRTTDGGTESRRRRDKRIGKRGERNVLLICQKKRSALHCALFVADKGFYCPQ